MLTFLAIPLAIALAILLIFVLPKWLKNDRPP